MKPDPAVVPWSVCVWLQEELEDHSLDVASIALLDADETPEAWTFTQRDNPFFYLSDERFLELGQYLIDETTAAVPGIIERLAYIAATWGFKEMLIGVCPSCRRIGHGTNHPKW